MSNLLHPYNYWESNGQYYFDAPSGAPLSCPVVTGHFCRWAKAAGEESPSGMLLPAAGAAVAAGLASTGSVAHQPHPIRAQKPLVLVTELSANPIGAQKPFISGTKCWLLLYSFPEMVILGHGLRAERLLMGKV